MTVSQPTNSSIFALIGGAGYGKSTALHTLMSQLKKRGIDAEHVYEYAKLFVLNNIHTGSGALTDDQQLANFNSLVHATLTFQRAGTRIILQESCPLICLIYAELEEQTAIFPKLSHEFQIYERATLTHYLLIEPYKGYQHNQRGRYHDAAASARAHARMREWLEQHRPGRFKVFRSDESHKIFNVIRNNI